MDCTKLNYTVLGPISLASYYTASQGANLWHTGLPCRNNWCGHCYSAVKIPERGFVELSRRCSSIHIGRYWAASWRTAESQPGLRVVTCHIEIKANKNRKLKDSSPSQLEELPPPAGDMKITEQGHPPTSFFMRRHNESFAFFLPSFAGKKELYQASTGEFGRGKILCLL